MEREQLKNGPRGFSFFSLLACLLSTWWLNLHILIIYPPSRAGSEAV